MGGFLSGLTDLLGGFNSARRIDKEGFDWREQQAQENLARQQQQTGWQQQNEDWATKATAEAASGAPEDFNVESAIPQEVGNAATRARVALRAGGAAKQSKSALAAEKARNDAYLQSLKGNDTIRLEQVRSLNRLKAIAATGDERESIVRLQEDLLNGREANPRDKYIAGEAAKRASQSGGGGGMQGARLVPNELGEYEWLLRPSSPGQSSQTIPTGVKMAPTSIERTRREQAGNVLEQGRALIDAYNSPGAKDIIGGFTGYANEKRTTSPGATLLADAFGAAPVDPLYQKIRTSEASMAAFQPILHGSRGGENMLAHFENNIRGNPAVGIGPRIAAVEAIMEAAQRIEQVGLDADLSDLEQRVYGGARGGTGKAPAPAGSTGRHGPAVAQRRLPNGRTQKRDANGVVWEE